MVICDGRQRYRDLSFDKMCWCIQAEDSPYVNIDGNNAVKNTVNTDSGNSRASVTKEFRQRLSSAQREKLLAAFAAFKGEVASDTVLDVNNMHASVFDTPIIRAAELSADGRLPFADDTFDWVRCDGSIEKMENAAQQYALLKDLHRVARKGVFVTTPNRWHPLEFHTGLPLIHWLPHAWQNRWLVRRMPRLLGSGELYRLAARLPGAPQHDVGHKRVWGIKAHFFLMITKNIDSSQAAVMSTPEKFGT
ncbi:hypothetical protein D3870_08215 [Noviherbaspirillum cavernae]|uniref:Methyltransferase type 11 domain-containing protein n=2 Tax=Noviherbaspirillum cavernae TaxID=2320862 RepID=A0A418X0Y8_9BURK|nr:hypothetical protein D3870_08215 [Noviherbaspirillum cavernae]